MQYIPTNVKINLEWSVKKGIGNEAEDFSRATVSLFLFNDENRWAVPCTADYTGLVKAELPETLEEGVYSLDLVWIKNDKSINETRCVQRTRKTCVFIIDSAVSLTADARDVSPMPDIPPITVPGQPVTVKMTTVAAPYGYDGLSAYEAAVMRGIQINISEREWSEILYNYEASEQGRVEAEQEREQNEGIRRENESARNASELLREGQEATRQSNENTRQAAEQSRATQEDARQESEQGRVEAEQEREQEEGFRRENESGRNATERTRNMNEGIRQAQEQEREQEEAIRQAQEKTRQAQEEARQARVVQTPGEDASLVMSQKAVTEKLTELGSDKQNKDAEVYENASKEFFVSDANGNVVAKIGSYGIVATTISVKCDDGIKNLIDLLSTKVDKDGDKVLSDENFTSKLKSALEGYNDSVINLGEGLYITDSDGHVAFKIEPNGEVYFNGKSESGSALGLEKFELFSLGDSLSVGGVWQEEVARLTGCMFRQHINIKPGSNLSTGGTVSYQDGYDTTFWRAKNLIDGGYIKGDGENAIVVIENVNDQGSPETVFDKNAVPVIPTAPIDGYSVSTRNDVPAELRKLNAVLRTYYTTSGKNLKITQLPVKDGAVTLNVSDSAASANYNIEVKTSDSIADIIDKILEVNYARVPDTLADDGVSVDFAGASVNLSFTDTDNTGMQVSITSTSSAKGARAAYFIGTLLEEWGDESKWVYGAELTLSQGYKTTIEMLQRAYPKLRIVIAAFPFHAVTAADYLLPNGRYDSKAYSETARMQRMKVFREYLNQIAEYYSIPLVDVTYKCGIGINNMLSYYQATANVHPKEEGYIRFGKTVAAELMSNIK